VQVWREIGQKAHNTVEISNPIVVRKCLNFPQIFVPFDELGLENHLNILFSLLSLLAAYPRKANSTNEVVRHSIVQG
jgi:hypothetical protein